MTDRALLAEECLQIEKSGGDVLDYLKSKGAVSPWGTWFRLQREELGRQMCQINDGKGRKRLMRLTLDDKKKAVQIAVDGGNPLNFLRELGSSNPCDCWEKIKKGLEQADPELYAKLPERLPRVKKNNNPLFAKAKKLEAPEQRETYHGTFHNENRNPPPPPPGCVPTVKVDGAIRIETPETKKVEVVETPELKMGPIPKPIENIDVPPLKPGLRGLNNSDFTVSAIKHPQLGEFYYDQKFNSIDWRSPEGEEISLHPAMWKELYMIIPDVMGILGVPDYE